ncbi:mechanosensitive ion channel family protein [Streptomyces sp. NPDC059853]|uniref:mechanosensitive ion channel family protein n=1 Tax=Streptomyces sp. NPDC059853 TaxID=3346973 RepID=UPI00365D68BD
MPRPDRFSPAYRAPRRDYGGRVMREHWEAWLGTGLRIALIVVIALVLRVVVRRSISRLIKRMHRDDKRRAGSPSRGSALLANPERRIQRAAAIGSVLRSAASVLVLGTAALMVLSQLSIELGPLVASAGILGVAIGFGARNLVTDVLSGMFMLLEDQYGVGDRIDAGEASGTVVEIGLRVTTLRAESGELWYVRNGEIKRVANLSQGWATAQLDVEVRAEADYAQVHKLITAVGEELHTGGPPWDELLWEPVEVLGLESVSLDTMVVRVKGKVAPGKAATVERELRRRVKEALDAAGIAQVDPAAVTLEKLRAAPPGTLRNTEG